MSETGSVKFTCEHIVRQVAPFAEFHELNACRQQLLEARLIGVDSRGVGYGNLSIRAAEARAFYITGSGASASKDLDMSGVARVTAFDFDLNWLQCEGVVTASSESLTHAAVYESDPRAGAVIHCHHAELWARLRSRVPTTSHEVEYGTPAMAREVQRLFCETDVRKQQIFAMGGHPDGLVSFGESMRGALAVLHSFL